MQTFASVDNEELRTLLKQGAVGVLPTDTVYGLVCMASSEPAIERLFTVKSREANPGTVLAASVQQLIDLGLRGRYVKAVEHYWPNAISVVITCADNLLYLHQGKRSLAVRIPDDEVLRGLLRQTGPLMTTSANHPGQPTANTIAEAKAYFGNDVDFYVDGGVLRDRPPSTIIRIVDDAIEVLREGAVKINEAGRIQRV
ncbi:threonylcarbamoyl-AMP synthase [Candidatus Saccharibacteria bacterium]|nr:MAG: threonylcarbamoyl-AMP synthase [Candidatus Saccharibacteria bacterium]